jgi:hypothetical protein
MALAHIVEDLPGVLCDHAVTRADYDRVLDEIMQCLEETQSFGPRFRSKLLAHAGKVIRHGARVPLGVLRAYAWEQYEMRKKLSG